MNEEKKMSTKKKILIIVCIVLAVVLILVAAAVIYFESLISRINRTDPTADPTETGTSGGSGGGISIIDPDALKDNVFNVLLIGQDRRPGETRQRSDSMILCTFNKKKGTLTMTSFMRDLYVEIPGRGSNRINASYAMGGFELLDKTLDHNFGVKVDNNVEVDFDGFAAIVDALGGVKIELTSQEAAYLNRRGNWDVSTVADWTLVEGENLLKGEQALAYSRIRDIGSDFERTNRQRKVLTKIVEEFKKMNISQTLSMINTVLPYVTTDMTDAEIRSYAISLFPMLGRTELISQRIPGDGGYKDETINGMMVLVPNLDDCRRRLQYSIEEEQ